LQLQTRPPDEVIVAAPDDTHVEAAPVDLNVAYVFGANGLTAQRNLALDKAVVRSDIVTFFDDDFLPADDYLEGVVGAFATHPDWAVVTGQVVQDGINGAGLEFEAGITSLREARSGGVNYTACELVGAYGCNMSMRTQQIAGMRFDERLPLYGWQEDTDFTQRLRKHGRIVRVSTLQGVHLGVKSGRVSGVRFGYSQIANPIYLIRKGNMPARFGATLICRNVLANLGRSLWPEPWVDRRGRLAGNMLAVWHVVQGRVEPEYIMKL
jgi:GT2 family glycosyltransferase